MKHVAVIGAGFIGKSIIRNLLARNNEVSVLDRGSCTVEFERRLRWIKADFHDKEALGHVLRGVSVVYHLISTTVPGDQHVDVAMELNENVIASLRLVDACVRAGVERIVFASSASVYGLQPNIPIDESAPTNPISAHGIHKLTVEKFLLLAHHLHGIDVRILRIANPYGPEQSLEGRQGFIAIAIGSILRGASVVLRDMGRPVRDFIYIDDLAEALVLAGINDGSPHILNIGSGTGHSLQSVLDLMGRLMDSKIPTSYTESRVVDIPVSVLDARLARSAISFAPTVGLEEGLFRTLRHHHVPVRQYSYGG